MPINLSKGQKVDLTKGNPGLKNIMVGLGWDVNAFDSGVDFDLDAAAFMLGADGKCPTDKEFVFYGNLAHPSESVKHMGDNLTGEGEGDDEQIQIDLSKVPANIERIAFTVTIYEAEARRQNFGQVSNSFIRLVLSLIHISEPTRRTPISYAVFCLKKKKHTNHKPCNPIKIQYTTQ